MSSTTYNRSTEIWMSNFVQLNRYFSIFIFFFGTIGNILNILVLSRPSFRSNSCILLFLVSSIANLISILSGLTPRILFSWKLDLTTTNDLLCKLRAFMMFTSRTIGLWLIMLATIDRWVISSANTRRRQLSSLYITQRGILIIIIIAILLYSQMFYCYKANLINTPLKCYGKTTLCRLLTDITYASLTILFPIILMITFGLMTLANIRQTRARMESRITTKEKETDNENLMFRKKQKQRGKKLDRYLLRMLLLQVILLILLTFPQAIHKLYLTITLNIHKTALNYDFDRFLYNFDLLLPYLESGMPFYIYTLTGGKKFRKSLGKLISCSKQK